MKNMCLLENHTRKGYWIIRNIWDMICWITSSLHVWCPISCAMSSGVLSCLFRCEGSAPARRSSFIASALSCRAERCSAVSPSMVVLSIPPLGIFCTRKSTMYRLLPISRRMAKCNAVSPTSWNRNWFLGICFLLTLIVRVFLLSSRT